MKKRKSILFQMLHSQRRILSIRVAVELLHGGLTILAAWNTAAIVNTVFLGHGGLAETASELLMLFLCIFAMALLRLPKSRIEAQLSDDLRLYCRRALHRELLAHGQNGAGVLTLTLERVDALDPWFRTLLPPMIAGVVIIPLVLLVTAVVDPLSALLFLVTLPIAPFLLYLIGKATRRASERQWDEMRTLTDGFGDLVRAAATLKIFRRVDAEGLHLGLHRPASHGRRHDLSGGILRAHPCAAVLSAAA